MNWHVKLCSKPLPSSVNVKEGPAHAFAPEFVPTTPLERVYIVRLAQICALSGAKQG